MGQLFCKLTDLLLISIDLSHLGFSELGLQVGHFLSELQSPQGASHELFCGLEQILPELGLVLALYILCLPDTDQKQRTQVVKALDNER